MNRNVGGISFSLSPVLPENRWYARGLYPVFGRGFMPVQVPRAAQEVDRGALLRLAGELQEALP